MEYHTSKATAVAFRIFEKGLDTFGEELEYVLRYLGFLISVNDENSNNFYSSSTARVTVLRIVNR